MINKIIKLNNLGLFKGSTWADSDLQFGKVNLLYGFTGSGKTMLSNVLRMFSKDLPSDEQCAILDQLRNKESVDVEIELLWDSKKVRSFSERKSIFVFNSHFVNEHVYDGSSSKLKHFKASVVTTEHLKNPEIKKSEDSISVKQQQYEQNQKQITQLSELARTTRANLSNLWNASISGPRLPQNLNLNNPEIIPHGASEITLDELENQLADHYRKFKVTKSNYDLQKDEKTLEERTFEKLTIPLAIESQLQKDISQEAYKKIKGRLDTLKESELKHSSVQEWFEDGVVLLTDSKDRQKCPLCDSDIPNIREIIEDYNSFFNEEFVGLQKALAAEVQQLNTILETARNDKDRFDILSKIIHKYQFIEKLTKDQKSLLQEYSIIELEDVVNSAKNLVVKKQKQLETLFFDKDLAPIRDALEEIRAYNKTIDKIETLRKKALVELKRSSFNLNTAKETAKDCFWKKFDTLGHVYAKKYARSNEGKKTDQMGGIEFYKYLIEINECLSREIGQCRKDKLVLLSKLKKESEFVNSFLQQLCIANFKIRVGDKEEDDIEVIYGDGVTKKGIKYSLSEGEKTALAFAYFLSKVKYEILDNTQSRLKDHVMVIDDPVSSLDENRLFSTALLIKAMFARDSKQLFVFSHNLVFLKFMGSVLGKVDNEERKDFYLENGKIEGLPKTLQNFQTSYFYKLGRLQAYLDGEVDYESAKDVIPNCARIVLESFLSFKLCRLKQGSGASNRYKSAGLDRLIPAIDGVSLTGFTPVGNINDKKSLVQTLCEIKNRVDPESHGTPQDITEFEFLPESELKKVTHNTLDVIAFLDQIHIREVSRLGTQG